MACAINLRAGHGWGPKDQVKMVKRLTITEGAAGQQPVIRFDKIPARDKLGRFGHLVGLGWIGRLSATPVAATTTQAMPAQLLLTSLTAIAVMAGGRQFTASIDGADLDDDMILRENIRLGAALTDIADAADAILTRDLALLWTFGRPHQSERDGARTLDCAIPLSLFNANADSEAGLRFQIDTAFRSAGGDIDAFPGVTVQGFITAGEELEVYGLLRYEDEMHVDVPWQVRRIAGPELTGRYVAGALCHYLVVRDRVKTTVDADRWNVDHQDYSGIRVQAGDETILDGRTAREAARVSNGITLLGDRQAAGLRELTAATPEYLPLIIVPPGARRATLANGDVSWSFDARTDHARTRVLMRGYGDYDQDFEIKARACMPGLGSPNDVRVTSSVSSSAKAGEIANLLPVAVQPAKGQG